MITIIRPIPDGSRYLNNILATTKCIETNKSLLKENSCKPLSTKKYTMLVKGSGPTDLLSNCWTTKRVSTIYLLLQSVEVVLNCLLT